MKLVEFIKANENWKELLTQAPYHLRIQEEGNLVLFKYNQYESDFGLEIVQESRGIILEKDTWKVLMLPFLKFFNHGETYAHEIDWATATYEEKFDGSLIKVWYYEAEERWVISSNGNIYAANAGIPGVMGRKHMNFENLFLDVFPLKLEQLDTDHTYVFELISPYNTIVVEYKTPEVILLMVRDRHTLQELDHVQLRGVRRPIRRTAKDINAMLAMTQGMTHQEEGFIVKDQFNNRIKIKSAEYVKMHHLITGMSNKEALRIVVAGEVEEVVAYMPRYKEMLLETQKAFNGVLADMEALGNKVIAMNEQGIARKEIALAIKDEVHKGFGFVKLNEPGRTARTHLVEHTFECNVLELVAKKIRENQEEL